MIDNNRNTAMTLGIAGLLPFIVLPWAALFVTHGLAAKFLFLQLFYAGIIICFISGNQWGYAVGMGRAGRPVLFTVSILPPVAIFAVAACYGWLFENGPVLYFVTAAILLVQALWDHFVLAEKWFLRLRWLLTGVAVTMLVLSGFLIR